MSWPCREDLFGPLMDDARAEWAEVARAIARFEPVTVVVDPSQEAEARRLLGTDVELLVMPLDDSWIRDNGPIFVRDEDGRVAAVQFRFDGWNEQFTPYDKDAEVPARIADAWGAKLYQAPFVLEGGAFNTDGEGTLITTEQCLLHNRNLGLSRADNEALLREWLGVDKVIWLPFGLVEDSGPLSTSGHVDDVAQFVAPGVVVAQTAPTGNVNHGRLQENLEVAEGGDRRCGTQARSGGAGAAALRAGRGRRAGRSHRARRRQAHAGALCQYGLRRGRRAPAADRRRRRSRGVSPGSARWSAASPSACRRSSRRSGAAGSAASRSRCPPGSSSRRSHERHDVGSSALRPRPR